MLKALSLCWAFLILYCCCSGHVDCVRCQCSGIVFLPAACFTMSYKKIQAYVLMGKVSEWILYFFLIISFFSINPGVTWNLMKFYLASLDFFFFLLFNSWDFWEFHFCLKKKKKKSLQIFSFYTFPKISS